MQRDRTSWIIVCLFLFYTVAVCRAADTPSTDKLPSTEQEFRDEYFKKEVALRGTVLGATGNPLPNVSVQLEDHTGTEIKGQSATTDGQGGFTLKKVKRGNYLLRLTRSGFRTEILPISLHRPTATKDVVLDPIVLDDEHDSVVRFLFSGDVAFARRFLDSTGLVPRDQVPPDDPNALIRVSDPGPGSMSAVQYVRPYYQEVDWGVINLETPVTTDISTPHPTKAFAFFTLPQSLEALQWLGVDYVTLGNNHVYDYLQRGIEDTLWNLDHAGIPHSGGGRNGTEAYGAYRASVKGYPYAFVGATSITGEEHAITYVADEHKGGAANATDATAFVSAIRREERAGYIPIVQIHGGIEYSFEPGEGMLQRFRLAAASGAALVVSHHPHVAQGVGLSEGILTLHCLGNFIFDQARLETMLGLVARIDMAGRDVRALRLLPVYLEDFRPRPISGRLAASFLRRIGEFSHKHGVLVYPYNGQGWVVLDPKSVRVSDRQVGIDVKVPDSGVAIVDLRPVAHAEESLLKVSTGGDKVTIQMGRDLMDHGDMEDWDSDEDTLEASRWDTTSVANYPCLTFAYRGVAGLCSSRFQKSEKDAVIAFRNRIRVMGDAINEPNKNLSFFGYMSGQEAGALKLIARYFSSEEEEIEARVYGEEIILTHGGGTFAWQPISADLHMPPEDPAYPNDPAHNARALRVFFRHSPNGKDAKVSFDDIAIINWEETFPGSTGKELATPHARDFLRITAPPGDYHVALTFRSYRPSAVAE